MKNARPLQNGGRVFQNFCPNALPSVMVATTTTIFIITPFSTINVTYLDKLELQRGKRN